MNKNLPEWVLKDLKKSGIDSDTAKKAGFSHVKQDQYKDLLGFTWSGATDGYAIPFLTPVTEEAMLTPDGKPYIRIKLREPAKFDKGLAKYLSPKEGGVHAYFYPGTSWKTSETPMIITEGEKKAICGCQNGLPTIGLTGVFGFHDPKTKGLLADLEPYIEKDREVVYVLDSDAAINIDIALAAHRFHECTRLRNCHMKVLVIPPDFRKEGKDIVAEKVGMDDYLVKYGVSMLKELLATAVPLTENVGEVYTQWLQGYVLACQKSDAVAEAVAQDILHKGYYDWITASTRRDIIGYCQDIFPQLAEALIAGIMAKLGDKFSDSTPPEHGGEGLTTGCYVNAPDYNEPLKVDSLDRDIAWCFEPGQKYRSRPFPRKLLVATQLPRGGAANGSLGGRPMSPTVTDMCDAFLAQPAMTVDKVCTLRHYRGQWYMWTGHRYIQINQQDVESMVMSFLRQHPLYNSSATANKQRDIMAQLKALDVANVPSSVDIPVWIETKGEFQTAEHIMAMGNGIANINKLACVLNGDKHPENELFHPPTPRMFSITGVDYNFDPIATCPMFEKYLMEVQPDVKAREVLQMMMGLMLVADTSYNVFFILQGRGGEGKSVFLYILEHLVGRDNICKVPFAKLGEKFSVHLLTEKLVNIIGEGDTELPRSAGLGRIEGILKDICDGGLIATERKFQEPGKARATARCIMATNSLPSFYDRSEAIWDRLRIIPFNERIRGSKKDDPQLRNKIVEQELPGIFNFALAGLAKLRNLNKFPEVPAGVDMKEKHRLRCDHESEFLTSNYYEEITGNPLSSTDMYELYKRWMKGNNYHPLGMNKFTESVERVFPSAVHDRCRIDGKQVRAWKGLASVEEGEQ